MSIHTIFRRTLLELSLWCTSTRRTASTVKSVPNSLSIFRLSDPVSRMSKVYFPCPTRLDVTQTTHQSCPTTDQDSLVTHTLRHLPFLCFPSNYRRLYLPVVLAFVSVELCRPRGSFYRQKESNPT